MSVDFKDFNELEKYITEHPDEAPMCLAVFGLFMKELQQTTVYTASTNIVLDASPNRTRTALRKFIDEKKKLLSELTSATRNGPEVKP